MSRILAGLAAALLAPAIAGATADGPDHYAVTGVTPGHTLSLRTGPSLEAQKIGRIPHDARGLANRGCRGGPTLAEWAEMTEAERRESRNRRWCKVVWRGVEGWVAGRYLKEDSAPSVP